MKKFNLFIMASLLSLISMSTLADTKVKLQTSAGDIVIELNSQKAPLSSKNFTDYVKSGFYDGLIFHRVIPGFMIQGGGFTPAMQQKTPNAPIKNEATNGLSNVRGTISMARTNVVDSATSQFFINLVDNDFLNYQSAQNYGYAVFGRVVEGMTVVDEIAKAKTQRSGPHQNVPVTPITIIKAEMMP